MTSSHSKKGRPAQSGGPEPSGNGPTSGDEAPGLSFEDALDRLEALVEEMEAGDLPLEETIARFEEGQKLLRTCGDLLGRAELRVKTILRRADGALEAEPFEAEEEPGGED